MDSSPALDAEAEIALLQRQLERERRARARAEQEGEQATGRLYVTVQQLREAQAELQQRVADQQLLHEIGRELRRDLEPYLVMSRAVEAVGRATGAERCVIRLANEHSGIGEIVEQWHTPEVEPLTSHRDLSPALSELCLEAARQYRSVILDETTFATDPPSQEILEALDRIHVRSYAGTPMWAGSELVGWVSLHHIREARTWSRHSIELAEALAHDVAIALLQSQAYQGQSQAVARLQELDRVKSELLATVSHELRTPLTSIAGYIELLGDSDPSSLGERQREMLALVERNTRRLRGLVEDLLLLSAENSGSPAASHRVPLELGQTLEEMRDRLATYSNGRTLEFTLQVSDDVPSVLGDRNHLERVIENLVSNAVKFSPEGGSIAIRATRDDRDAVITVSDSGLGIAERDMPLVFDRFFRSALANHLQIQGTGLGLSVVQSLVRAHDGTVEIESVPDLGTTVTVRLPGLSD
jgi:signal transduction histidine kinase